VPVRSEQPHGTSGAPSDSALRRVMSSVTKSNGPDEPEFPIARVRHSGQGHSAGL